MFLAEVVNVLADERDIDPESGRLDLERAGMMAYCHGEYFRLGDALGHFGCSVRKPRKGSRAKRKRREEGRRFGARVFGSGGAVGLGGRDCRAERLAA